MVAIAAPALAKAAPWDLGVDGLRFSPEVVGGGTLGIVGFAAAVLMLRRGGRRPGKERTTPSSRTPDATELSERLARELRILSDALGRLAVSVNVPPDSSPAGPSEGPELLSGVAKQVARANALLRLKGQNSAGEEGWVERVEDSVSGLEGLAESAAAMEGLLATMGELSERIQLLAINTAIEAAKAGESGRGLARVADDVRVMARDSRHAAREIEHVMDKTARSARELRELVVSGAAVYRSALVFERRRQRQAGEAAHLLTRVGGDLETLRSMVATPPPGQDPAVRSSEPKLAGVLVELQGAANQLSALSERLNDCLRRPSG